MVTSAGSAHIDTMIVTAGKAYEKGDFYIVGGISGICLDDIAKDEKGTIQTAGVFNGYTKATGVALDIGDHVYSKDATATIVGASGAKKVGFAMSDAAGNATKVDIVLNFGGSS